jgi:hypothetical protein
MKKSTLVTLVLSGALAGGCDDQSQNGRSGQAANTILTNNTYTPSLGYYHAPYRGWFEYPYNYYRPGFGYYHGGTYSPQPEVSDVVASFPSRPFTFGTGGVGGGGHIGSIASSSSVSRGGFGSIGHGGFSGS